MGFLSNPSLQKDICKSFHQKPTENLCLCIFVVENASFEALPLFVCHVCNVEAGGRAQLQKMRQDRSLYM